MNSRTYIGGEAQASPRVRTGIVLVMAVLAGLGLGRFAGYRQPATAPAMISPRDSQTVIEALRRQVEARPDNAGLWQDLAGAYLRRAGQVGDPQLILAAEQAIGQAQGLAPNDPATLVATANLAMARHRFHEARDWGDRAARAAPDSAESLVVLVDASIELGRYDEAEGYLQTLLDRKPNLAALARLSYFRELQGDRDGAIQAMLAARTAGGGEGYEIAQIDTFIGNLLYGQGELEQAAEAFGRARRQPDTILASIGEARVLAVHGDLESAVALLEDVVAHYPLTEAVVLLGELQAAVGDSAASQNTFALVEAIGELQRQAGSVVDLEMALYQADHGDAAAAVELATKAYRERQTIFTADALGWAMFKNGDAAGAVQLMEEAAKLGTADPLLSFHAATVYQAAGFEARARLELLKVVELNPRFSVFHQLALDDLRAELGV